MALACLEGLSERGFPLTEAEVRVGVRETRWPGRLEEVPTRPAIVLDGAHNPAGVAALLRALETDYAGRSVHLVFGVFKDKDSEPMMRALFPRCAAVYLTPIDSPRSKSPASYEALARTLCPSVHRAHSAMEAIDLASAGASEGIVVVAGSLALVGEVRRRLIERGALTR